MSRIDAPSISSKRADDLVSVIIPVYNGEKYLADAIDSVLRQTYAQIELIVIDDGSVDKTADIARAYPEVIYIYQKNSGNGIARNVGIANANGAFVALLDADDIWRPTKLAKQIDFLCTHSHFDIAICHMELLLEDGVQSSTRYVARQQRNQAAYLPSAMCVHRHVLDEVGQYDQSLPIGNDFDWFFRAIDTGIEIGVVPEPLLIRRLHGDNLSANTSAVTSDLLRLVRSSVVRKRQTVHN